MMLAAMHHDRGLMLRGRREYDEAAKAFRDALSARIEVLGDDHKDIAESLFQLACLERDRKRPNEAKTLYEEALEMRRKVLGDLHPDVTRCAYEFGKFLHTHGQLVEAESHFRQTLAIQRQLYDPLDERIAMSHYRVGLTLFDQEKYQEAEAPFRESLAIIRSIHDDDHGQTVRVVNLLAQTFYNRGDEQSVEKLYADDREYRQRAHSVLFGKDWKVQFYVWRPSAAKTPPADWDAIKAQSPLEEHTADAVDFRWDHRAPVPGVPDDHFVTVARSTIELAAGQYELHVVANDGVRAFVDEQQLIDRWEIGTSTKQVAMLSLAGGRHDIRVEHFELDRSAELRLWLRMIPAPISNRGSHARLPSLDGPSRPVQKRQGSYSGERANRMGANWYSCTDPVVF